ncbi:MAG: hydroxymethylbilane synthase, partial [Pseudomonadota bacterium]
RVDDGPVNELLEKENDFASAAAVIAERALMRRLEGGCQVPIGAHGTLEGERLTLRAYLGSLDGGRHIRDEIEGPAGDAAELGERLANRMYEAGGEAILAEVRSEAGEGHISPPNHP